MLYVAVNGIQTERTFSPAAAKNECKGNRPSCVVQRSQKTVLFAAVRFTHQSAETVSPDRLAALSRDQESDAHGPRGLAFELVQASQQRGIGAQPGGKEPIKGPPPAQRFTLTHLPFVTDRELLPTPGPAT